MMNLNKHKSKLIKQMLKIQNESNMNKNESKQHKWIKNNLKIKIYKMNKKESE